MDQLQVPEDSRLLLISIQLEESAMGVLFVVRHERAAMDGFLTRQDGLDWADAMRRSPDLLRFHLRDASEGRIPSSIDRADDAAATWINDAPR